MLTQQGKDVAIMKPAVSNLLWALAGTLVLTTLVLVGLRTRQNPSELLLSKTHRLELVAAMRSQLTAESEAEKSAVLATGDADSQNYADEARAHAKEIDRLGATLVLKDAAENQLLAAFAKDFSELHRVDEELLNLAVQNTNLKASALAYGPAAEAITQFDEALSRMTEPPRVLLIASRARAAALRIALLLPPHIAEESDAKMDALEARMKKEDDEVRADLKQLPQAQAAAAAYEKLSQLRKQILALSRANTNVRSLSISLNQKRRLMLVCEDELANLEKSIAAEPVPGAPMMPR